MYNMHGLDIGGDRDTIWSSHGQAHRLQASARPLHEQYLHVLTIVSWLSNHAGGSGGAVTAIVLVDGRGLDCLSDNARGRRGAVTAVVAVDGSEGDV